MVCKKCGVFLDPKFKECPLCKEKTDKKERRDELNRRKIYAKEKKKEIRIDTNIKDQRRYENPKEPFGRKRRFETAKPGDFIPLIIAAVVIILIICII